MSMFKSSNPTLAQKYFNTTYTNYASAQGLMTVRGTINKFGLLMIAVFVSAGFTWHLFNEGKQSTMMVLTFGGAIVGFILALIMCFKPTAARYIAPAYAIAEGLFLGGISVIINNAVNAQHATDASGLANSGYNNIVMQAVGLTFGVAISMFLLYNFKIIKVTERFRSIIIMATFGIAIFYLLSWIISLFGVNMNFAFGNSLMSIGISIFIVIIAALNLLLDFDMIEQNASNGAPKYMEWFAAFGLLVTLVWLYLEILKLLSKINSRD
ncbi:MAG: Bax inhibitor-1/YccA family protein [Sediminibacterium sp.]|nr:Bax inhibitor-1/YccA family protein [Sediminibacterium sp.]